MIKKLKESQLWNCFKWQTKLTFCNKTFHQSEHLKSSHYLSFQIFSKLFDCLDNLPFRELGKCWHNLMALVLMIIWWLWPHYGDIIGWLYDVTCWLWWWKWWRWLYLPSCVCIAKARHDPLKNYVLVPSTTTFWILVKNRKIIFFKKPFCAGKGS